MTTDKLSVRGLIDSDFDLPVKSFSGIFAGYEKEPARGYDGTRIVLHYTDIEDVVCAEGQVYNLPTVTLNIGLSNKHKSRWGYYSDSLVEFLDDDEDIDDKFGSRQHVEFCDGESGRAKPKPIWSRDADQEKFPDKMVPTAVWIITAVEGSTAGKKGKDDGVDAVAWAEENIIGKTRAEFNKWAYSDPIVRKDTALTRSITDKSFINGLLTLGKIVEDENGVFELVE